MSLVVRSPSGDCVSRSWERMTVVCIASGPSVTQQQLEIVRRARERDAVRVIVVNDMYLVAPWADVLYFADDKWWRWQLQGVAKSWPWAKFGTDDVKKAFAGFAGQKVTIEHPTMATGPDIFTLKKDGADGLSEKQNAIRTGSNSGFQAMNIAALSGASRILLVGYDLRYIGGRTHSHNGHSAKENESVYMAYAQRFSTLERPMEKLGIDVANCTPGSAVKTFRTSTLEAELRECAPIS
jgi:hypothetical protein